MSKLYKNAKALIESRFTWARFIILFVLGTLTARLWYIQVYKGDFYSKISSANMIRRIEIPAPRGRIFDRNDKIILGNKPFLDLVFIPQYVKDKDKTLKIISELLNIPLPKLERALRRQRGLPKFLPIVLKRNLSIHQMSIIDSNHIFLPGIEVKVSPRRDYKPETPPHLVGYLGEINRKKILALNKEKTDNFYRPGDLIGKQGLEKRWESYLRGKAGHRFIQVNALGHKINANKKLNWKLPRQEATPGSDLILTIDLELQKAVKKAFRGKNGAVVVLNPKNGDILAMLSEPSFDPSIYQKSLSLEKWASLINAPYKPLFDKTTGGEFPPGSTYKPVVAMAALEEKIINKDTKFLCTGSMKVGDQTFHCHHRAGHGWVNLKKAIMKSCDIYFYNIGLELGVDKIAEYAKSFGLGKKLNVGLNIERKGLIPTSAWKKLTTRTPWMIGDTPAISIGQGSNLVTPIQLASLFSTIANGGTVYRPRLIESIVNHLGKKLYKEKTQVLSKIENITPKTFKIIKETLKAVVMDPKGTGKRAFVKGHTVAGKTGSVQVVSLKRNRNQSNVSMKWKEHALFASFSPVENAEIAIAIISENDRIGGGGKAAAPVSAEIMKAYWDLKKKRLSHTQTKRPLNVKQ